MMTTLPTLILAAFIPLLILLITSTLTMKSSIQWKDRETSSPFECGFSPVSTARMPFSLRFFLLAVLFIIFDMEIIILIPTPIILSNTPINLIVWPLTSFLLIVTLGLIHEWNEGSLEWMK